MDATFFKRAWSVIIVRMLVEKTLASGAGKRSHPYDAANQLLRDGTNN